MNLDGLLALMIFVGMIGIAFLLMIIALPIRFAGKNKLWFMKLSMCAISFFIIGLLGGAILVIKDSGGSSREFKKAMDNYGAWSGLGLAFIMSAVIFVKKSQTKTE